MNTDEHRFKIGVMSDSFRLPTIREGVLKSKDVGADGIQVYAVKGEICPEAMDAATRADFRAFCAELGLEIAALCGDLGGHGFQRAEENPAKIECSKKIVDLAVDLGTNIVTTHIGVVPSTTSSETWQTMLSACRELGVYAESKNVTFAIETGPESAELLKRFLDGIGSKGIGVNLDPANLVMVMGDDPVQAVYTLKNYIVHTHAKDGVQLAPCDPVKVYGAFAGDDVEGFDFAKYFNELPLGEGAVDWDGYLKALEEIGYHGFLTIEREVGDDPASDIRNAVKFLRGKITIET